MTVQQIDQTVVVFGNQDGHAQAPIGHRQAPVQLEFLRNRGKVPDEIAQGKVEFRGIELHAH